MGLEKTDPAGVEQGGILVRAGVKFLQVLKKSKGISGYEVAKRLKIPHNTYYYYEAKAYTVPLNLLVKIRRVFDLSWAQLGQFIEEEFSEEPKKRGKK